MQISSRGSVDDIYSAERQAVKVWLFSYMPISIALLNCIFKAFQAAVDVEVGGQINLLNCFET